MEAFLVAAVAHERLSDAMAAESDLERALELAAPTRLVWPFVASPVRELLRRHRRGQTANGAMLADVLATFDGSQPVDRSAGATLLEPLSESELRVLRYLTSNLRASEIARELYVSVHTVKTHMRHVYAKLGVHRRGEAVQRARELGLLGSAPRLGAAA